MKLLNLIVTDFSREDIISLPLRKLVYPLVLPAVMQSLIVGLNTLVDSFYIARLINTTALTGVAFVSPYFVITTALTSLLSIGAGVMYSRSIGQGNVQQLGVITGYVYTVPLLIGLPIGALFIFFSDSFASWAGVSSNAMGYASCYLQFIMGGLPLSMTALGLVSLLRSSGRIGRAFMVMTCGVCCNALLVPLFTGVFGWGIVGVAVGTLTSYLLMVGLAGAALRDNRAVWPFAHQHYMLIKEMLLTGFSAFAMQLTGFVKQLILYRLMVQVGNLNDQTFFAAVQRLYAFAVIPLFGFLQALQPVIGIHFGGGLRVRVRQSVELFRNYAVATLLLLALVCMFFHEPLVRLLLPDYVVNRTQLIQFCLLFSVMGIAPLGGTVMVFFQNTGHQYMAIIMGLVKDVGLFLFTSVLLTALWGVTGIYMAILLENLLYGGLMLYLFYRLLRRGSFYTGVS